MYKQPIKPKSGSKSGCWNSTEETDPQLFEALSAQTLQMSFSDKPMMQISEDHVVISFPWRAWM